MEYKLVKNFFDEVCGVNKLVDGIQVLSIPFAPDNTDYQAYLKWVAEGNTPLPAESN
jgi:hypothetical protein